MADPTPQALIAEVHKAVRLLKQGQRANALLIHQEVKARSANLGPVQFELGHLCREIGDLDKAIGHYAAAVELAPDSPGYLSALGIMYLETGDNEKARATLERAVRLDDHDDSAHHGLGAYFMYEDDFDSALPELERACELKPSDPGIRRNLALTLSHLERHEEALVHAEKAVRLDAAAPEGHLVLAETLSEMGDIDAAQKQIEKILRKNASSGLAYELLARIRKFSAEDDALVRRAEKALEKGMEPRERIALHFALGKIHDDRGEFDAAFANYAQGNLLKKRNRDEKKDERLARTMQRTFTARYLQANADLGHESATPVFIVGMPRSGTTLMERIIGAHPRAAGAGERPEISRIARQLFPHEHGESGAARARFELSAAEARRYAEGYLEALATGREDADRIVDKMPGNFYYVGLIRTLFPQATIIHAHRHPLDTCLSCYFQSFKYLDWTNDLVSIAKTYRLYREIMAHWNAVLPAGTIVDVSYEKLVEDPATHARRMLDACGLEWDDSVLSYFERRGVIRTASVAQARMPIYKTSRMRWLNYASHLQPLVEHLGPYLQDDADELRARGIEPARRGGWLRQLFG